MLMCKQNLVEFCPLVLKILSGNENYDGTRTVRGSDYSPAVELSEQKDKLVTATGDTKNILKNKPIKSGYILFIGSQDIEQKQNSDINKGP